MYRIIFCLLLLSHSTVTNAQCSDCTSLEEALKDPEKVVRLKLSNQGLNKFPEEIAQMVNLRELDLSENPITGYQLSKPLASLKKLSLKSTIPDPYNLEQLKVNFPNLEQLDLSECHLATLPQSAFDFPRLTTLNLAENGLRFLPEDLSQLTSLRQLNLSGNQLEETGTVIANMWKINELDVSGNPKLHVLGLLNSLKTNTNLNHLTLSPHFFNGEINRLLEEFQVKELTLVGLKDKLPKGVYSNPFIEEITIKNGLSIASLSDELKKMPQLRTLILDKTAIPADLDKVSQLEKLVLKGSETANITAIRNWAFLKEIDLVNTRFDPAVVEEIASALPNTKIVTNYQEIQEEMAANTLPAISELPFIETRFTAEEPRRIEVQDVVFAIPAGGFLLPDGSEYTGDVKMDVKVFDNAIDMALEGAPMAFTEENGRVELFSSDGMMDVRAQTADGTNLSVNPSKPIMVTIPDLQPSQASNLYVFNQQSNQWSQTSSNPATVNNDSLIRVLTDSLNKIDLSSYVNFRHADRLFAIDFKKKNVDASQLRLTTYRPSKIEKTQFNSHIYSRQHREGKLIAKQTWHIDTIMSPKLRSMLHGIDSSYSLSPGHIKSSKFYFYSEPRLMQNVHVNPDFTRDHYRLTFNYRDTAYNIPVYLEGKSSRKTMLRHKRFQKELEKCRKKDELDEAKLQLQKKATIEKYLATNRESIIRQLVQQEVNRLTNPQFIAGPPNSTFVTSLTFPLPSFGLVNCDFFQRVQMQQRLASAAKLTDQDSVTYDAPEVVRVVYPEFNSYMTTYSKSIPTVQLGKTIILLELGADLLGVLIASEETKALPSEIRTINTKGKTAQFIRNFILSEP